MSKGSPIVPIRIPADLLARIEEAIQRRNEVTRKEPWTRTGFILAAIEDKLAHNARGSKAGRKRKGGTSGDRH